MNPVYELLKQYLTKDSEVVEEKKPNKITEVEILKKPNLGYKGLKSKKSNGKTNFKLSKISWNDQRSEDWENLETESRKTKKSGKEKTNKSRINELTENVFFKLKTIKKTKAELERRQVQIVYKYLKIKK